jgi:hypothetical protein
VTGAGVHRHHEIAAAYVALVNDPMSGRVAEIFAPNAQLCTGSGKCYVGRAEIEGFFAGSVARSKVKARLGAVCSGGTEMMFLIEVETATGGEERAVDYARVGPDGLVSRLVVFIRPA